MGAGIGGTRAVHDPRSGLLLRRHGPEPQRAQHADDELLVPARSCRSCWVDRRVLAGLQRRRRRSSATSTGPSSTDIDITGDDGGDGATLLAVAFLGMFAVITPALISGAVADRMKFSAWAIFVPLWLVLVYCPCRSGSTAACWGDGASPAGSASGARSTSPVARSSTSTPASPPSPPCSCSASARAGRRRATRRTRCRSSCSAPASCGSAGSASTPAPPSPPTAAAIQAFMNTFLAAAAAGLAWAVVERIRDGHFTNLGAASGIVAGLVAITPAAGFVSGMSPIAIGAIAGVVCCYAVQAQVQGRLRRRPRRRRRPLRRRPRRLAARSASSPTPSSSAARFERGPVLRRRARPPRRAAARQRGDDRLLVRRDVRHHEGPRPRRSASGCPRRTRPRASTSPSTPRPPTTAPN